MDHKQFQIFMKTILKAGCALVLSSTSMHDGDEFVPAEEFFAEYNKIGVIHATSILCFEHKSIFKVQTREQTYYFSSEDYDECRKSLLSEYVQKHRELT